MTERSSTTTAVFDTPVSDILRGARKLLSDEKRWIKGAYLDGDSFCLMGAITESLGEPHDRDKYNTWCEAQVSTRTVIEEMISVEFPEHDNEYAEDFNDAASTTHADVLRVLDLAIAEASEREANNAT